MLAQEIDYTCQTCGKEYGKREAKRQPNGAPARCTGCNGQIKGRKTWVRVLPGDQR